jgi:tetratricopeptide (TPR) repeat protein
MFKHFGNSSVMNDTSNPLYLTFKDNILMTLKKWFMVFVIGLIIVCTVTNCTVHSSQNDAQDKSHTSLKDLIKHNTISGGGQYTRVAQAKAFKPQLELAKTYNDQADKYYQQGRFQKALPLAEKAFNIFTELLGEKHQNTITSLNNLAATWV